MIFVCTVDGRIAGNCQISFTRRIKTRHRATLAIGILEKFWGLGIGPAMIIWLERVPRDTGLLALELDYVRGNGGGLRI